MALEGLVGLGHAALLACAPHVSAPAAPLPFPARWGCFSLGCKEPMVHFAAWERCGAGARFLKVLLTHSGNRIFPGSVMINVWGVVDRGMCVCLCLFASLTTLCEGFFSFHFPHWSSCLLLIISLSFRSLLR